MCRVRRKLSYKERERAAQTSPKADEVFFLFGLALIAILRGRLRLVSDIVCGQVRGPSQAPLECQKVCVPTQRLKSQKRIGSHI